MTNHAAPTEDRLLQLLCDRATEGLDHRTAEELNNLLGMYPQYGAAHLEPAAAAIDMAMTPAVTEPLPGILRDRVLIEAGRFLGRQRID
jgi:hypothetical protein